MTVSCCRSSKPSVYQHVAKDNLKQQSFTAFHIDAQLKGKKFVIKFNFKIEINTGNNYKYFNEIGFSFIYEAGF